MSSWRNEVREEIVRRAVRVMDTEDAIWTGPRSNSLSNPILVRPGTTRGPRVVNVNAFLWQEFTGDDVTGAVWLFKHTCSVTNGHCINPAHLEVDQILSMEEFRSIQSAYEWSRGQAA